MLCLVERSTLSEGVSPLGSLNRTWEVMEKKEVVFTTLTPIVWLLDAFRQQESGSAEKSSSQVSSEKRLIDQAAMPIMVASQNTCGSLKRPTADDDEVPKKPAKKMAPKKASFAPKPQTPVSSQDVSQLSFATSAD
ncbi:hypothetical protein MMC31_003899 [Peltigera leucophlebia]|nr:hypothetical protein [Peltigera leucophlebia]